jgi:hypothetical protein
VKEKLLTILNRFKKGGAEKKEKERKGVKLKLSENCTRGEGRKVYSLHLKDFRVKLSDKKGDFSVYDPVTKKWIVYTRKGKGREIPLFPILLEFAKKKKRTVTLYVGAECGSVKVTVLPHMDKVNQKVAVKFDRKENVESDVIISYLNVLSANSFLLLTDSKELKEKIEQRIDSLPQPEPVKETMRKNFAESFILVDDVVSYLLEEVKGSKELYLKKDLEIPPKVLIGVATALVLVVGGVLGFSYYKKKKEEEEWLRQMQEQKKAWTPSLSFKEKHLFYREFLGDSKVFNKVFTSLFTAPEYYTVDEVNFARGKGEVIYATLLLPEKGERKRGRWIVKETFSSSPSPPSWEELRRREEVELLPFSVLFKDGLFLFSLREGLVKVYDKDVEGVKLTCGDFEVRKRLTLSELYRFWKEAVYQFKVDTLHLKKEGELYFLDFKGTFCGR